MLYLKGIQGIRELERTFRCELSSSLSPQKLAKLTCIRVQQVESSGLFNVLGLRGLLGGLCIGQESSLAATVKKQRIAMLISSENNRLLPKQERISPNREKKSTQPFLLLAVTQKSNCLGHFHDQTGKGNGFIHLRSDYHVDTGHVTNVRLEEPSSLPATGFSF